MEKHSNKLEKALWSQLFDLLDDTHDLITQKLGDRYRKAETQPKAAAVDIGSEGSAKKSEK
jgi:hypothetical protein